nr:hypothetical protein [Tanacetum cinerariifolium]
MHNNIMAAGSRDHPPMLAPGRYAQWRLRKPKRVKDFAYHKEKMLLCKQAEQGVPLQAKQYD